LWNCYASACDNSTLGKQLVASSGTTAAFNDCALLPPRLAQCTASLLNSAVHKHPYCGPLWYQKFTDMKHVLLVCFLRFPQVLGADSRPRVMLHRRSNCSASVGLLGLHRLRQQQDQGQQQLLWYKKASTAVKA
jgi:hypothetical protein